MIDKKVRPKSVYTSFHSWSHFRLGTILLHKRDILKNHTVKADTAIKAQTPVFEDLIVSLYPDDCVV